MLTAFAALCAVVLPPASQDLEAPLTEPVPIVIDQVLAIESVGEPVRAALRRDALLARLARDPGYSPTLGEAVNSTTGEERQWREFVANEKGNFSGPPFRGGWAFARIEVPASGSYRLNLEGATSVRVDGEPRYGDVYSLGITRLPMYLEAGEHSLLFRCGRGRLKAQLEPCPPIYLEERDLTRPSVVDGEDTTLLVGVIIGNASRTVFDSGAIKAIQGSRTIDTLVPVVQPNSLRKVWIQVQPELLPEREGDTDPRTAAVELLLMDLLDASLEENLQFNLRRRSSTESHERTFISRIDGSLQYYAVTPPSEAVEDSAQLPMVLSLHGASVEGRRQARCYSGDDWCHVVAPTNRRPFGFDWEDWGRKDALEVLELASQRYGRDPLRTHVTGHSMGGHGTWSLGSLFPDRFATVAPSAGWREFWSYGGGGDWDSEDALGALFNRAAHASRTTGFIDNLKHSGVYVLHGDKDDNVPVSEARAMKSWLADNHTDFAYYERPGAGHWWGNRCVDWPPLMDFLRRHETPPVSAVSEVNFSTPSPGISSHCYWVEALDQELALGWSRVSARFQRQRGLVQLEVENVRHLRLDLAALGVAPDGFEGGQLEVLVDEEVVHSQPWSSAQAAKSIVLEHTEGSWAETVAPGSAHKTPERYGPFKEAFDHRMLFVYGTQGTPQENAWSFAKARFDHETWRYRGNGAVDVVADVDFDPNLEPDRGVVLYGNRDTNSAFGALFADADFDLTRAQLRVGDVVREDSELAFLACTPRPGSAVALVALVGGTGPIGCHTTDELPYFTSGCHFPDWCALSPQTHLSDIDGVLGAGFFGRDWTSTGPGSTSHWR